MHNFFTALGRFTVKYRWVILVVWIVGTFAAVKGLPSLSSQVNNDNTAFLPSSAPDVKAANLAAPLVGKVSLAPITVVADRTNATLTSADVTAVEREAQLLKHVTNVQQVLFLGSSPNGRAIQIEALANINGFGIQPAVNAINATVATFDKAAPPAGLQFHVAGQVADAVAQNAASKSSGNEVQEFSLLFIIVLLFLIFRSVLAPFVTLIPAALVLQVAGSFIGELGAHGLKISGVSQLLLIVLVLGAGTDYGLFLVFRVREGLRNGLEPNEAVALAVSRVGESISASAGTVILALLSLLFATFGIYHDLGIPLAIGIATMLIAGLTLLPALLAILGRAVFWPSRPREGQPNEGLWGKVAERGGREARPHSRSRCDHLRASGIGRVLLHTCRLRGSRRCSCRLECRAGGRRTGTRLPTGKREPHQPDPRLPDFCLGRSVASPQGSATSCEFVAVQEGRRTARSERQCADYERVHTSSRPSRRAEVPSGPPAQGSELVDYGVRDVPRRRPVRERGRKGGAVRGRTFSG